MTVEKPPRVHTPALSQERRNRPAEIKNMIPQLIPIMRRPYHGSIDIEARSGDLVPRAYSARLKGLDI